LRFYTCIKGTLQKYNRGTGLQTLRLTFDVPIADSPPTPESAAD
jgi:hypothetical protein